MLKRQRYHNGCPIDGCSGGEYFNPSLSHSNPYRVALVGEALGETEAEEGRPFAGKAGFKLTRLIEWAGLEREKFDIWNVVWCRPPDNNLEGMPFEKAAIEYWRPYWEPLISRVNVVVPMGNVPLGAFTGRKGILTQRGYIIPGPQGTHLLPTVHPSFIQRGQSKYSAAFIHDLQKAVELARNGMVFEVGDYLLDPSPMDAYTWAKRYVAHLEAHPDTPLAFDIETPGKGDDEGELDNDDDPTYFIWRIGFSYTPHSALSIPWEPPYIPAIRLLLESAGDKVVWNANFDVPRIRHNGVEINGLIHDGMVAWHILHSDLPKGLGFVATFTCPYQPPWKHLSKQTPAFYNATDADVELRSFLSIVSELKTAGLWSVYERDVLELDPILQHMSKMGMPIDGEVRLDRAIKLEEKRVALLSVMSALVPLEARRVEHVYKSVPKDTTGLMVRTIPQTVDICERCGVERPKKDHFKVYKRKPNPCGAAHTIQRVQDGPEYYRLGDFTPSRDQLIRYNETLGRVIPTKWDKKTKTRKKTMDEKALKGLIVKYPLDKLYPSVLSYREVEKVAGTYIGRVVDDGL